MEKAEADHELEIKGLKKEVYQSETLIQETVEEAEKLMQDIEALKAQLQLLNISCDCFKIKNTECCLTEMMSYCRMWSSQITKELLKSRAQHDLLHKER